MLTHLSLVENRAYHARDENERGCYCDRSRASLPLSNERARQQGHP